MRVAEFTDHPIAAEHDYRIRRLQLLQLGVFALLDFQIVRGRIAPTRRAKEPDLSALCINEFTVAASGLHLSQLLLYGDISLCSPGISDHLI